jgi:hypothetical protein
MDELLAHMMPDNVVLHHPAISPFSPRLPRHRRTDSALRGILFNGSPQIPDQSWLAVTRRT